MLCLADLSWMVSCPHKSDNPERCYIDVVNIGYFASQPGVKSDVDMPWLDNDRLQILTHAAFPPQRVLFNLPFLYYVKLVIVLFSDHHLLLL